MRLGYGETIGETEQGGLVQYENGHIEVSSKAQNHAMSAFPEYPTQVAIGVALINDAGWVGDAAHPATISNGDGSDDDNE